MTDHDKQAQRDIIGQSRDKQVRFVYYIIALSVAAIGFSIHQTSSQKLDYHHIALGFGILLWAFSIFCGFQFLQIMLKVLDANNNYFNIVKNVSDEQLNKANEIFRDKVDNYRKRAQRNFMWQQYLFYLGLASFMVWHIIQMSRN